MFVTLATTHPPLDLLAGARQESHVTLTALCTVHQVPEIQKPLRFTEVRSNAVTDTAFIGSSYVTDKSQHEPAKTPQQLMTKVYRLESGLDVMQLVIRDRIPPRPTSPPAPRTRLHPLGQNGAAAAGLATRLSQLLLFSQLPWQLMICWPGWDLQRDIRSLAARAAMETIKELEEERKPSIAELEELGGIKARMTGAIAGMAIVKKKTAQLPAPPPKVLSYVEINYFLAGVLSE